MRQQTLGDFRSDYATRTDFCNAFTSHTNSFYLLVFLLTTTHAAAERCFVDVTEQAFKPNTVFREWTVSWIRRTLMARAITMVFGEFNRGKQSADRWYQGRGESGLAIDAITCLGDLDRFVFVMSVLEGYSVHECSLLLGCSPAAVTESRARTLRGLPPLTSLVDEESDRNVSVASRTKNSA
jgi:DNA-directed RNA polymerase specialized sigma24 family protein